MSSTRGFSRFTADRWLAALAGFAAVAAGIGASELVAAVLAPAASPLFVVGSFIIDLSPAWLKDFVIGLFGTADKLVLLACVGLLVAVLAAIAGVLEQVRPPMGRVLVLVVGAAGILIAATRANATWTWALPSATALVVAVVMLRVLVQRLARRSTERQPQNLVSQDFNATPPDRRSFLVFAGATTLVGVLAAVGGRIASSAVQTVDAARRMFTLPQPAVAAAAIPPGAALDVPDIAPLVTANANFYRIDTALFVPAVDPATWSLKISGLVEQEVTLSFDELLALDLEESYTTLACVSNYVGGDLIGNALWLGYPIRKLLARAKPHANADMVLSRSIDGFTAGTPLTALTDDRNAILAVGMNGMPLPAEHGFPVRMVVPGLYGYVSATKWVTELTVTRFADATAYWTDRGWSPRGPVKLSSRIDTPHDGQTIAAGPTVIAGVAWSQHVGISRVEVRVDDGGWNDATLADALSIDTWRQWSIPWSATNGQHTLTVRATDKNGKLQTAMVADVIPNGATGLHSVGISVR